MRENNSKNVTKLNQLTIKNKKKRWFLPIMECKQHSIQRTRDIDLHTIHTRIKSNPIGFHLSTWRQLINHEHSKINFFPQVKTSGSKILTVLGAALLESPPWAQTRGGSFNQPHFRDRIWGHASSLERHGFSFKKKRRGYLCDQSRGDF